MSGRWSWKDRDPAVAAEMKLRYEPGGWGDVLKGEWTIEVVEALRPDRPLVYVDPFAGARSYPVSEAVRARLDGSPASRYLASHPPGRLRSAAALVEWLCEGSWEPHLGEADDERRASWPPEATADDPTDAAQRADLIMWDPYDFHHHWADQLPDLLRWAERAPVLIYLFNRSPQGVSQSRQYRSMRERMKPAPHWVGRIPSDASLPRAYHEMILLGAQHLPPSCGQRLRQRTELLASWLACQGCFEGQTSFIRAQDEL